MVGANFLVELNNQPVHTNLCQSAHGPLQEPASFTDLHFQCPLLVGRAMLSDYAICGGNGRELPI